MLTIWFPGNTLEHADHTNPRLMNSGDTVVGSHAFQFQFACKCRLQMAKKPGLIVVWRLEREQSRVF